jgi:hypothetical protein
LSEMHKAELWTSEYKDERRRPNACRTLASTSATPPSDLPYSINLKAHLKPSRKMYSNTPATYTLMLTYIETNPPPHAMPSPSLDQENKPVAPRVTVDAPSEDTPDDIDKKREEKKKKHDQRGETFLASMCAVM